MFATRGTHVHMHSRLLEDTIKITATTASLKTTNMVRRQPKYLTSGHLEAYLIHFSAGIPEGMIG